MHFISKRDFEYREGFIRDTKKSALGRVETVFLNEGRFTNV
jgi:hypothetical protein